MYQFEATNRKNIIFRSDNRPVIQPKLKIGKPGDKYEQEADAMADRVMNIGAANNLQMQPLEEEELIHPKLRMKPLKEEEGLLQTNTFNNSIPAKNYIIDNTDLLSQFSINNKIEHQAGNIIQRVPMPNESTVNTLTDYTEGSRQGIRYDTGFDWQSVVSRFFVRGIDMDVRSGYNVTFAVRGFPSGEEWVSNALKALVLYNFNLNSTSTEIPVLNITSVQHLDLSSFTNPADSAIHGTNANFRFTSTQFDATGPRAARIQNIQLLIEKLSDFTATTSTETADQRRQRFATSYQITNAVPVRNDPLGDPLEAMTDSQYDQVLVGLNLLPDNILSRVTGIPIHRSLDARGAHNEIAEYKHTRASGSSTWERRIVVYNDFFRMNAEQKAFTLAHEIGHAIDFRPNEASGGSGNPSASATTGRGSFREAVRLDGGLAKGVSTYAVTSTDYDEYYAEAFAMYRGQPDTLKAIRPNVYQYFIIQFP